MSIKSIESGVWISNEPIPISEFDETWKWREELDPEFLLHDENNMNLFMIDVEGRGELGEEYDLVCETQFISNLFCVDDFFSCFHFRKCSCSLSLFQK